MKKLICLLLCLVCVCSFALAADTHRSDAFIDKLIVGGFVQGTDDGLELDAPLNRAQAAIFCTRVIGGVYDAHETRADHPFTDVPDWASAEVGYLYAKGYVNGTSDTLYDAEETVSAQQFYAMLLRCLGYHEKNGDFRYADTLSFARSIGLLSAEEAAAIETGFDRDGAVVAMYNALRCSPKGKVDPLCSIVAGGLNASYSVEVADVLLGRSKVYNILRDANDAMDALDNYTMTQTGTYETSGTDQKALVRETYECTVLSAMQNATAVYNTVLKTTADGKTSTLTETLYTDPVLMMLVRDENGTRSVETISDVGRALALEYVAVHELFAPDSTYITNFDCLETDDAYLLEGFNCRYDLLYDITSDEMTGYYYDMRIVVDKETKRIASAEIAYIDAWETEDGSRLNIKYLVKFAFSDFNTTDIADAAKEARAAMGIEA